MTELSARPRNLDASFPADNLDTTAVFREAMSRLAGTVVVVTSTIDGRPWGMTVSACCSVSASPPTLLIALGNQTTSRHTILSTGSFGVSILDVGNVPAALRGSQARAPKFLDGLCDHDADAGASNPSVRGALAQIDCAVSEAFEIHDHTLFIGAVNDVTLGDPGGRPLLYFDRAFRAIGECVS